MTHSKPTTKPTIVFLDDFTFFPNPQVEAAIMALIVQRAIPKPCKYCGFVATRLSDEDCPARPWWVKLRQWWAQL